MMEKRLSRSLQQKINHCVRIWIRQIYDKSKCAKPFSLLLIRIMVRIREFLRKFSLLRYRAIVRFFFAYSSIYNDCSALGMGCLGLGRGLQSPSALITKVLIDRWRSTSPGRFSLALRATTHERKMRHTPDHIDIAPIVVRDQEAGVLYDAVKTDDILTHTLVWGKNSHTDTDKQTVCCSQYTFALYSEAP